MFRVNNKDTRTTAMGSFWCLYCLLWTYFTTCSSIFMVNFEHVIAGWVGSFLLHEFFLIVICKLGTISPWDIKKGLRALGIKQILQYYGSLTSLETSSCFGNKLFVFCKIFSNYLCYWWFISWVKHWPRYLLCATLCNQ